MDKPKSPCKKDCEFRSAKCHNESCPYGWAEYEEQKRIYDIENAKREACVPITIGHSDRRASYSRALKRKGKMIFGRM